MLVQVQNPGDEPPVVFQIIDPLEQDSDRSYYSDDTDHEPVILIAPDLRDIEPEIPNE